MPRIIYIIAGIGIVVILVFLLLFGFGSEQQQTKKVVLEDYAFTDALVSLTTDGVINGSDEHRAIKIAIDKNFRTLTVYRGYQGTVLSTESFVNDGNAFKQFLAALQVAGFLQAKKSSTTNMDGQCPLGLRYIYASSNIDNIPNNLWATSCSEKQGTLAGDSSLINQLFQKQIANYSTFISDVKLY